MSLQSEVFGKDGELNLKPTFTIMGDFHICSKVFLYKAIEWLDDFKIKAALV